MVQQNPNVIRLMDWLDSTMEVLDEKIQEGTVRSNANYLSFFEDKSEELYRLHYMYKCLNDLRSNIRKLETPQNFAHWRSYVRKAIKELLEKKLFTDCYISNDFIFFIR